MPKENMADVHKSRRLRVAVITRDEGWFSQADYYYGLVQSLVKLGVDCVPIRQDQAIPEHCQVVWDPNLGLRRVPGILLSSLKPVASTVHFCNPFRLSLLDSWPNWKYWIDLQRRRFVILREWRLFARKVCAVFAISNFSAGQIESVLRVPHEKIVMVHQGLQQDVYNTKAPPYAYPKPYFLHVSTGNNPLKNLKRILRAYLRLSSSFRPDLILKISHYEGPALDIPGVTLIPDIFSPAQMASLYRGAQALIFPSLFEGFGIPIIEAMACGCPVLTSDQTACPETAGSAGICVNPHSIGAIAGAMHRLGSDESLRRELTASGLERARQFRWSKTAAVYKRVFSRLADGSRSEVNRKSDS